MFRSTEGSTLASDIVFGMLLLDMPADTAQELSLRAIHQEDFQLLDSEPGSICCCTGANDQKQYLEVVISPTGQSTSSVTIGLTSSIAMGIRSPFWRSLIASVTSNVRAGSSNQSRLENAIRDMYDGLTRPHGTASSL